MYKIVCAEESCLNLALLKAEEEVNSLKKEGWTEQGGISISTTKYTAITFYTVAQAMVKPE